MLLYLAHAYQGKQENVDRARRIAHDLQLQDHANCVVCPLLNFSFLNYNEIGYEQEMDLCLDLLSACDALVVASEVTEGVQREIDFAKLVGMEVIDLEEEYREV